MTPIGELRQRLAYQEPSTADDAYGDAVETWSTIATVWGRVTPTAGSEPVVGEQLRAEVTHLVTIRYPAAAVSPTGRFFYRNRYLNVVAVLDDDERRRELKITCKEVNPSV